MNRRSRQSVSDGPLYFTFFESVFICTTNLQILGPPRDEFITRPLE
jgi:hypothetical protein